MDRLMTELVLDRRCDVGVTWLMLTPIHLLFLAADQRRRSAHRRLILVIFVDVDASSQIQRDVVDGGYHGTYERHPGEEERPAVPVGEGNAGSRGRRSLLAMRYFVVDGRNVEDHAYRQ